jgi:hypothetical protein
VTSRTPDFDEIVGRDVDPTERDRLLRVHDLLVEAGPPPELSPELEEVQWPDEALAPLRLRRRDRERRRSPLLVAAVLLTVATAGFLLGQATDNGSQSGFDTRRVVNLSGTRLDRDAVGTLQLGARNRAGNWSMLLHVRRLQPLPEGGYYDLYLTRGGKPTALCGSFSVDPTGEAIVRLSAAYDLPHFDKNGWIITRQVPPNHEPTDVVLRPRA